MTGKFFSVSPFSLAYPLEFFSNFWSGWIGDHAQEDLAPIWQEVKEGVRKSWDSPHKAATCWNLMSKYGSFSFFYLMIWRLGPIFMKENPLYLWYSHFFLRKLWKFGETKDTLSETYHTNRVGSPWILEPICRIYLTTHSPNYISLAIYFSTYQIPKLACLLAYLSTSYNSLFMCSPIYQLHTQAYLLTYLLPNTL
jgi:hypothetical protein